MSKAMLELRVSILYAILDTERIELTASPRQPALETVNVLVRTFIHSSL